MLKELTSRRNLFICLHKGRSCTYLDVKTDIKLLKNSIPVFYWLYTPINILFVV